MPIIFPGDENGVQPTTFSGVQNVGGVEKYATVNGSTINISNLNAGNITTGTLSADRIGAGTITADKLNVNYIIAGGAAADVNSNSTEISAGKILISGSTQLSDWRHPSNQTLIDGGDIYANSVTADKINASTLSAISADLGTVTAGAINGLTITGGIIRTSSSGQRVEMNASTDDIRFYNPAGSLRGIISAGDGTLTVESATEELYLQAGNGIVEILTSDLYVGGNIQMQNNNIYNVSRLEVDDIDESGQGFVEIKDDLDVDGWLAVGSWASLNGDLDMNSHDINECTGVNPPSETYIGTENLEEIVKSIQNVEPKGKIKTGKDPKKWGEIDHSKLHPTIKKTWEKRTLNKETGEIEITMKEGYGLFELVLVQNRMLIELSDKIKTLEGKLNAK